MKKSIPKVWERESEASILGNDREREFPLTPDCWAFPALGKEICPVLLNQKDGIDVVFWIWELEHPVFIGGAIFIMGKQILPHINYMRLFHY